MCKCSDQDLFTRWRNGLNIREYANSVASLPPTRGPQRQFRALKNPQRLILRKKASEPSAKPISVFSFTSRFPMRYHLAMEEFRKHFYHNMLCHWPCTQVSGATGGEGYSGKSLELFPMLTSLSSIDKRGEVTANRWLVNSLCTPLAELINITGN